MILVTGATGFLGRYVVHQLLAEGQKVRILTRQEPKDTPFDLSKVDMHLGDLTDQTTLESAFADVEKVIHIAGHIDFNPPNSDQLIAVNEMGTRYIMELCQQHQVQRVVHVSSVSTIGGTRDPKVPLNEENFGEGTGTHLPYPSSKRRGELVALEYAQKGVPVVIVNPTFFAGPGDKNLSSARTIISFMKRQVWVGINRGGLGYTDVRDIAAGTVSALEKGRVGERYILGGHNIPVPEYHQAMSDVTGFPPPMIRLPVPVVRLLSYLGIAYYAILGVKRWVGPGDIEMGKQYWYYDYSKAQEELDMQARPVRESLSDTVDWLEEQGYVTRKTPKAALPASSQ